MRCPLGGSARAVVSSRAATTVAPTAVAFSANCACRSGIAPSVGRGAAGLASSAGQRGTRPSTARGTLSDPSAAAQRSPEGATAQNVDSPGPTSFAAVPVLFLVGALPDAKTPAVHAEVHQR